MKNWLLGMGLLLLANQGFGAETLLWSCTKGGNTEAVTVSLDSSGGESPYIVKIADAEIVSALGLTGSSFESHAKTLPGGSGLSGYEAIAEEYATGVDFTFDSGGVKLIQVASTSRGIVRDADLNWWFNPGLGGCVPAAAKN